MSAAANSEASAREQARAVIGHHSKSFSLASKLLPADVSVDAQVLYAYCRHVDDAVDEVPTAEQPAQLRALRTELDAVYGGGQLPDQLMTAFQGVVERRNIPRLYFDELIEGMAMDVDGYRYATQQELLTYCYRVAGTVGLMMCHVMGVRSDRALPLAAHLGIAMQLTNIARDVLEDWNRGRLYLPDAMLRRHGAGELRGQLTDPLPEALAATGVAATVAELLAQADVHYQLGDQGLRDLSGRCGFAVRVARLVYSDIGRMVRKQRCNPLAGRAYVSTARKLWLVVRAAWSTVITLPARARAGRLAQPKAIVRASDLIEDRPVAGWKLALLLLTLFGLVLGCGSPPPPMTAADFAEPGPSEESLAATSDQPSGLAQPMPDGSRAVTEAPQPATEAAPAVAAGPMPAVAVDAPPAKPVATDPASAPELVTAPESSPSIRKSVATRARRVAEPTKKPKPTTLAERPSRPSPAKSPAKPPAKPPAIAEAASTPQAQQAAAASVPAQPVATTGEVVVDIRGFENQRGQVLVALWRHGDGFPEQGRRAYGKRQVWLKGRAVRVTFTKVPPGGFAVAVHHDEDKDFEMDTGLFGIPTEGYGFSKDAIGNFGPPSFEEARYWLKGGERKQLRIKMRY